jgi:hypothetical protein
LAVEAGITGCAWSLDEIAELKKETSKPPTAVFLNSSTNVRQNYLPSAAALS